MKRIMTLDQVDSTNTYLKEHLPLLEENFLIVRALKQTNGRGRMTRKWFSSEDDLTFSMVYHPPVPLDKTSTVTLYGGLAVYEVLSAITGGEIRLKWPNDIIYNGKKLCGILCELVTGPVPAVIVGIGINVNSLGHESSVSSMAVSLREITGTLIDIDVLLGKIHDSLENILGGYTVPMGEMIVDRWLQSSDSMGKEVTAECHGEEIFGTIAGIDRHGALLVKESHTGEIITCTGEAMYKELNWKYV
jgi:BirA family transcriptional regulator, biotin operon repressor / biotin---[acetyl-CoA-carboxylase] ligase